MVILEMSLYILIERSILAYHTYNFVSMTSRSSKYQNTNPSFNVPQSNRFILIQSKTEKALNPQPNKYILERSQRRDIIPC